MCALIRLSPLESYGYKVTQNSHVNPASTPRQPRVNDAKTPRCARCGRGEITRREGLHARQNGPVGAAGWSMFSEFAPMRHGTTLRDEWFNQIGRASCR